MADQHLYSNRLVKEKSPYLLQHAHNPVDWYPWGEEAFEAAKKLDRPIFLSIGYATCHWCHVMERESFENAEIAKLMNEHFISIKVDREELPEVDGLYMDFAQSMMSGAAGWPLNVILTPDLQPFFATTYLPPYSKHGLMGLKDLVNRIAELWASEERTKILSQAEKIVEIFAESIQAKGDDLPEPEQVENAVDLLYKMADPVYGGIKGAPKFPIGYQASFMLAYLAKSKDNRALFLVERTLDMMHRGGIYDHLGGGFSRYSVDEKWLVPHFEKMLYDNAILAQSYQEAWQVTKKPLYRQVCEEICNYVLRDMTHAEGGFFSAEDADSEGREGKFYTWPYEEVIQVLGEKEAALFCEFYNITPDGNFEGRNILNTPIPLEEFASKKKEDVKQLQERFSAQRKKLWQVREKRIHPLKDDKILSAWNGLMIYSLAEAGCAFNNPVYLEAAVKAARFIQSHLWQDQKLLRRWRDDQAMFSGGLDEYAFLIRGLLSLFEADCGTEWLKWAVELSHILRHSFKEEDGAFYQTDGTDKNLLLRKCQFSDGAEPSGNAIHCENLLRLYQLTGDADYLNQAEDILKAVRNYMENYPPGYIYHIKNLQRYYDEPPRIIVALNSKKEYAKELRHLICESFIVHRSLIWQHHDIELEELVPSTQEQVAQDDKTTLYLCRGQTCQRPQTDFTVMQELIHKL
jgi:uncharacterized protein YyaL (SSP411 family)